MDPSELEAVRKAKILYRSCMNESESDTHRNLFFVTYGDIAYMTYIYIHDFRFLIPLCVSRVAMLEKVDSKPMLKTLKQPEFRWPVVGDGLGGEYQWSSRQWSLLKTLADMRNLHSKSVLIRLNVSPDDKNSSHYIIKVRHLYLT